MSKIAKDGSCSCQANAVASHTELLEKIRQLSFVKAELELYLDTHPRCKVALDYYYQTLDALKKLTDEFQAKYGPLVASGSIGEDEWTWTKGHWPWHREADILSGDWERVER